MGAVAATFGMVLPSFVIIYLISMWLNNFLEIRLIGSAFQGIRIAVGFLILDAGLRLGRKMKKKKASFAVMLGSGAVMLLINLFSLRISSVTLILLAGTAGLFLSFLSGKPAGRGGKKG